MTDCHVCRRHHPNDTGDCTRECRHRDAAIGLLCDGCHLAILRDLTTIETAWELSADGAVVTGRGGRGSNERSLPGGTEWLNWRQGSELRATLTGWARVWHEDATEDLPWPATTIEALLGWLRVHLHATGAAHEAVGDFAAELREWAQTARRIVGDVPTGQIIACPGIVEPCGRRLRVDVAQPEAEVYCRGCATTWTTGRLLLYVSEDAAESWADLEAIEVVYGVPERTLKRWGQRGLVRRRNGQYHVGDVQSVRRGNSNAATA
jgi:hypothetical protein